MQRLEVSGAVRPIYGSLGIKRLTLIVQLHTKLMVTVRDTSAHCCCSTRQLLMHSIPRIAREINT